MNYDKKRQKKEGEWFNKQQRDELAVRFISKSLFSCTSCNKRFLDFPSKVVCFHGKPYFKEDNISGPVCHKCCRQMTGAFL